MHNSMQVTFKSDFLSLDVTVIIMKNYNVIIKLL